MANRSWSLAPGPAWAVGIPWLLHACMVGSRIPHGSGITMDARMDAIFCCDCMLSFADGQFLDQGPRTEAKPSRTKNQGHVSTLLAIHCRGWTHACMDAIFCCDSYVTAWQRQRQKGQRAKKKQHSRTAQHSTAQQSSVLSLTSSSSCSNLSADMLTYTVCTS